MVATKSRIAGAAERSVEEWRRGRVWELQREDAACWQCVRSQKQTRKNGCCTRIDCPFFALLDLHHRCSNDAQTCTDYKQGSCLVCGQESASWSSN